MVVGSLGDVIGWRWPNRFIRHTRSGVAPGEVWVQIPGGITSCWAILGMTSRTSQNSLYVPYTVPTNRSPVLAPNLPVSTRDDSQVPRNDARSVA